MGKTVVFSEISRIAVERGRSVLILAHREELVKQAVDKLGKIGVRAQIEMAANRAEMNSLLFDPVVVASVQSLHGRLARFPPDTFDIVIVDEAHHAHEKAVMYKKIIEHFTESKVLGVTATPRVKKKKKGQLETFEGMGDFFDDVAFSMTILEAIQAGWLVDIRSYRSQARIDLSGLRRRKGDYDASELDERMKSQANLMAITEPLLEQCRDEPTIVFSCSVEHAHLLAETINKSCPYGAVALDGGTDDRIRAAQLERFERGEFTYLVNCALFTEGFDSPRIMNVAIGRPTMSLTLLTQMIGRGTRPLPGVVDGPETAEERIAAIRASKKPYCKVLDFAGASDLKLRPINVLEVLRPTLREDDKALAAKLEEVEERFAGQVADTNEMIALAKEEIQRENIERIRSRAKIEKQWKTVDPFALLHACAGGHTGQPPDASQIAELEAKGIENAALLDRSEAEVLLEGMRKRQREGLATYKQVRKLVQKGIPYARAEKMSFRVADMLIVELKQNGWKTPRTWQQRGLFDATVQQSEAQ